MRSNGFQIDTGCIFRVGFVWRSCVILVLMMAHFSIVSAQEELARTASWKVPDLADVEAAFEKWLNEVEADSEKRTRVLEAIQTQAEQLTVDRLEFVVGVMKVIHPEMEDYLRTAKTVRNQPSRVDFSALLARESIRPFVKNHVRLLLARWLAQNQLLDEALLELEQLNVADVLAPETLLFYRAMAQHQLFKKEACLDTVNQLLENEDEIPKRFATVSRLMAADIKPMEADSLDEIARMMKDIKRRQALYRSGTRVRNQEEEVIGKLDKIIEKIEQQRQQQQQQQQNGNSNSSQPMQDSQNAAGQGTGDVSAKQQVEGGEWGSLPPADRAAAMAEMSKDLPPHYRAVIEEYFRKLADAGGEDD